MIRFWVALFCILGIPLTAPARTRSAPPARAARAAPQKPAVIDYSQEPFIIEQYTTAVRFENDGTGEKDLTVRIRVQSDIGAKQLAVLVFAYNAANDQIDVRSLRVRNPDGTVATAGAEAVKETVASVVRDAPAYADYKEKHITVPALSPGAILEYEIVTRFVTPAAPGEFWFQYSFVDNAIALDERLEINIPESRKVILQSSAGLDYDTSHLSGRAIYRWKHSQLSQPVENPPDNAGPPNKSKRPSVQLTSFATWSAVARWYAQLETGRTEPTAEIRSKAQELTQDRANDVDKMQALYNYVSEKIRYVTVPFGAGSYRPHSASEVFLNQYADDQDKHTLLAAMLQAAGISAEAVLIPYATQLDPGVPSPAQFNHVMTAVPRSNDFIWMDSTVEVAPFRLLASPLRNKKALLVSASGDGKIVDTPADPPFGSVQHVDIDGQVSDLGKLSAQAQYSLRGDTELVLRLAFRKTPQTDWNELGRTILSLDGIHGDVTSVKPSDVLATQGPFQLDIVFTQSNFITWSGKKVKTTLPLLVIGLPDVPANNAKPIYLGSPLNVTVRLKLALPAEFVSQPPVATSIVRDFAAFRSSYQFTSHTIQAERSLDFKMREVPAARTGDYLAFTRAVAADENQALLVDNSTPGAATVPVSATVDDLIEAGLAAFNAGNAQAAIPLFERVIQLDPKHRQAWNDLGLSYMRIANYDAAVSAFRRQIEINPLDEHVHNYLGLALEQQRNLLEASAAFRKQIEMNPIDPVAHAALGGILLEQQDYAAAAPELDKATILSPENAGLQVNLGRAYLNINENEKALAAFEKAVALSPTPGVRNDIAYNLANGKFDLDKAHEYAESAISSAAAALVEIDLQHLTLDQLAEVARIGAYWDTLGWIYFQQGDLASAERYTVAAWRLDQLGEIGDHLGQIYERLGQKDRAVHAYALAISASDSLPETRARLTLLLGGNAQIDELASRETPELSALRTIAAGKLLAEDARADFLILLSPGEKSAHVEAVRFIRGDERLRAFADRLRLLDYGAVFPNTSALKIVRRGTLSCSEVSGDCVLTMARPVDVSTLN
jgi:tetratricopeptide (TPR) repeat protein/transglutaminase-like putative cysteine protease